MFTLQEQERMAYIQGKTEQSQLFALAADAEADTADVDAANTYIEEAMFGLPGEDFLVGIIEKVIAMSKQRVTKDDVVKLAAMLEDFQMEIHYQVDHTRGELHNALKALKGL